MAVTETPWTPASWRDREALQQPEWPDAGRAEIAREQLRSMPPLVFAGEARALQDALAEVAAGRAFLLQAGDCAEAFHDTPAGGDPQEPQNPLPEAGLAAPPPAAPGR